MSRFPWNFIKAKPNFCSGFPHTRGLSIVLTGGAVERIAADPVKKMTLLLHEKVHVLQRVLGERMELLYQGYGYQKFRLDSDPAAALNLAQNPDASASTWAIFLDGTSHFLATTIKATEDQFVFEDVLLALAEGGQGEFNVGAAVDMSLAAAWKKRFSTPTGFDHPNEVSAYLSGYLLRRDYLGTEPSLVGTANRSAGLTREFFKAAFALPPEGLAPRSACPTP